MSSEWFDERRLVKRNPIVTASGKSLPVEDAIPLIKDFGERPKRWGSFDEAQERPQGCNLFVRTEDRVYGLLVPEDRIAGAGIGEKKKSPERAAFDQQYSLVRVPPDAKIRAQVGVFKSDRYDEGRLAYWFNTIMGLVREADRGDYSSFSFGKDKADNLDAILNGAYGGRMVTEMRMITAAGVPPTDLKTREAHQAFTAAQDCMNNLLTDKSSIDAVVENYRKERAFWRDVPEVHDNFIPMTVLAAAMEYGKAGGEGNIQGEFDKITGPMERAGIEYMISSPSAEDLWPKDQRVWSQDKSYCIEPKDYGRPQVGAFKAHEYWKKMVVTEGMLNNGGMVLHGYGNTPYLIACNTIPEKVVNGYLETVREVEGHEETRAYQIHSGFLRLRLAGQAYNATNRDFDMTIDTFGKDDTEHGRPGIWVDPLFHRALKADKGFQRFMDEQGDATQIIESDPSETHLHPQNTSWLAPGLKIVNHCPKSLATLKPAKDRWLVLDESVEKLHQFLGGVGCNTGMVWTHRH